MSPRYNAKCISSLLPFNNIEVYLKNISMNLTLLWKLLSHSCRYILIIKQSMHVQMYMCYNEGAPEVSLHTLSSFRSRLYPLTSISPVSDWIPSQHMIPFSLTAVYISVPYFCSFMWKTDQMNIFLWKWQSNGMKHAINERSEILGDN